MRIIQILVISASLFFLIGCGTYSQSVQIDDSAYLLLIGNTDNIVVKIDDDRPIELSKETVSYNLNGRKATKIEITIGKHTIKITKNGIETVNRVFYVSNGNSFEIKL